MLNWWLEPPRIKILTISWALLILVLTAIPGKDMPDINFVSADKFAHAFVYGVLFLLTTRWSSNVPTGRNVVIVSALITTIYGILMEVMQETLFVDRFFDWSDVIANTIGVVLGIVIFRSLR
ncbi:MAG: VanZ family protein [Flavobacteriales bacterium]|nr:VanZ family protein [Flavobacteriales bacterium]